MKELYEYLKENNIRIEYFRDVENPSLKFYFCKNGKKYISGMHIPKNKRYSMDEFCIIVLNFISKIYGKGKLDEQAAEKGK